jgi:hypothetical protein
MYAKCKQVTGALTPKLSETLADLLYEIGKDSFEKRSYEAAIRWLERAYDTLAEQDMEELSPEASELRLSTMHNIGMYPAVWVLSRSEPICSSGTHENEHV